MDDVPTSKVARFRVCRFPGQIAAQWGMTFACKSVKIVLRVDAPSTQPGMPQDAWRKR